MALEPIDVIVDAGTPEDELDAVRSVFERVGVDAKVRDDYLRLSAADVLPYVVTFIAPVTWIAAKFAGGFTQKAGEDAWDEFRAGGWKGLAEFLGEISRARNGRPGVTTIRDPAGPDLDLDMEISDEALRALGDLDWTAMADGQLSWDASRGVWWFLQADRAPKGVSAPRRPRSARGD